MRLREITRRLGEQPTVKVGFLEGATYPGDGEHAGLPVATVAFWNEFGTSRAPARPFFRNAIAQHQGEWGQNLADFLKTTGYSRQSLALMGTLIKDQVVQSIVDTNSPPLAPS